MGSATMQRQARYLAQARVSSEQKLQRGRQTAGSPTIRQSIDDVAKHEPTVMLSVLNSSDDDPATSADWS